MKNFGRGFRGSWVGLVLLAINGCGLKQVQPDTSGLAPLSAENARFLVDFAGGKTFAPYWKVAGQTTSFRYDGFLWGLTSLPFIHADSGDLVMLDTGVGDPARLPVDLARERQYPAHVDGPDKSFAYIRGLQLGGLEVTNLPARLTMEQWQFQLLGLPLFDVKSWTLGTSLLRRARFAAFDNPRQTATLGMGDFYPNGRARWSGYEMKYRGLTPVPFIRLPVSGVEVEMLADSAGGPNLILTAEDWRAVSPHVRVVSRSRSSYPTWKGFVPVDVYDLQELQFGPVTLDRPTVWVRRGKRQDGVVSAFGLGPLRDRVVVFDFGRDRLWIGG